MKKQLACVLACALAFGSAALYAYGSRETSGAPEELVPDVQTATASDEALPALASVTAPSVNGDYQSPLVTLRADPYLYKHDGMYYFTGSYPEYDRIELTCADSVNGIAAAVPKTIWTMPTPPSGETRYVWAPELHYVMGEWVIYYAYSMNSEWAIKCCALRLNGDDPMHDDWEEMGVIAKVNGDNFSFNQMSLDMTVFEANGKWYAIWAQKPSQFVSNLYLAEMRTPYALATKPILLTKPEYGWEKEREDVNEGPAVMKHADKIFVSFSASATGYEYCMGLLEIDETDDPMIIGNWKKYSEPVFKTNETLKIYGPGHNSFVEGDEGEQLCILHFRSYKEIIGGNGNSLYDFNRHAHVMKITFDKSGKPIFNLDADELYNSQFTNHGK